MPFHAVTPAGRRWPHRSLEHQLNHRSSQGGLLFQPLNSGDRDAHFSVTPQPSGKNVFNVPLNFGVSPCALPGQTASGVGVSYPLASGLPKICCGQARTWQLNEVVTAGDAHQKPLRLGKAQQMSRGILMGLVGVTDRPPQDRCAYSKKPVAPVVSADEVVSHPFGHDAIVHAGWLVQTGSERLRH
jgi:hypothetical protein